MTNPIDFLTLAAIIAAGLHMGLVAFFGVNVPEAVLGSHATIAYELMGVSAVWQMLRQRFR